jgi:septum formation protein
MYLASKSPQRQTLLKALGVEFEAIVPEYEEEDSGRELPAELVERHSRGKAWSVLPWLRPLSPGKPILGVDTMVVIDGRAAGKATNDEEALAFLQRLSGRNHLVYSGATLVWTDPTDPDTPNEMTEHTVTEVRFAPISKREMELYVAGGEWKGRAGAYAIQGRASAFVEEIRGDYTSVVGLPVPLLVRMLKAIGCWPPQSWQR